MQTATAAAKRCPVCVKNISILQSLECFSPPSPSAPSLNGTKRCRRQGEGGGNTVLFHRLSPCKRWRARILISKCLGNFELDCALSTKRNEVFLARYLAHRFCEDYLYVICIIYILSYFSDVVLILNHDSCARLHPLLRLSVPAE